MQDDRTLRYVPSLTEFGAHIFDDPHSGYKHPCWQLRCLVNNYFVDTFHARAFDISHLLHLEVPMYTYLQLEQLAQTLIESYSTGRPVTLEYLSEICPSELARRALRGEMLPGYEIPDIRRDADRYFPSDWTDLQRYNQAPIPNKEYIENAYDTIYDLIDFVPIIVSLAQAAINIREASEEAQRLDNPYIPPAYATRTIDAFTMYIQAMQNWRDGNRTYAILDYFSVETKEFYDKVDCHHNHSNSDTDYKPGIDTQYPTTVWTRGLNDKEVLTTGMRRLSRDYIPSFLHSASHRADHVKQRVIRNPNLRDTIPSYTSIVQATPWNIDLYDRLCVMANAPTVMDCLDIGTLVTQQELEPLLTIPLIPQMEPFRLFHASPIPIYIHRTIRHPPEHNVNDVSIRVDVGHQL